MKKIYLILIALLLTLSYVGKSQEFEWGPTYSESKKTFLRYCIGSDDESIYTFGNLVDGYYIEKYRIEDQTIEYKQKIEFPSQGKLVRDLETCELFGDRIVVVYSIYNSRSKRITAYVYFVNTSTGTIEGNETRVLDLEVGKNNDRGFFSVFHSKDGSKMMIKYSAMNKKQHTYYSQFVLLNDNLEITAKKIENIDKREADFSRMNYLLANNGSMFFIKEYDSGELSIEVFEAKKNYESWEESINMKSLGLDLEATLSGVQLTSTEEDNVVLSGFYNSEDNLKGCFYHLVDGTSGEALTSKVTQFGDDFFEQYRTKSESTKNKDIDVPAYMNTSQIFTKSDGSIFIIGENIYTESAYRNGVNANMTNTFGDLIIVNLDIKGNLEWVKRIPKYQFYNESHGLVFVTTGSLGFQVQYPVGGRHYFSYLAAIDDDNLYVFYNGNTKNLKLEKGVKPSYIGGVKKTSLIKYELDLQSGEAKGSVVDMSDKGVFIRTDFSMQHGQNTDLVTYAKWKKNYKIGRIKFN